MAFKTDDYLISKWKEGKRFFFFGSGSSVLAGQSIDVVIDAGDEDIVVNYIRLRSDAESMNWQAFAGAQAGEDGTLILPTKRNLDAATPITAKARVSPTISAVGQPFFTPAAEIIAQVAAGNRAFVSEDIVTDFVALDLGRKYLIRVTNTSGSTAKVSLTIDMFIKRDD